MTDILTVMSMVVESEVVTMMGVHGAPKVGVR